MPCYFATRLVALLEITCSNSVNTQHNCTIVFNKDTEKTKYNSVIPRTANM